MLQVQPWKEKEKKKKDGIISVQWERLLFLIKNKTKEFSCGSVGSGPGIVTAVALVTAVARVWPLVSELLHVVGVAKKRYIKFKKLKQRNKPKTKPQLKPSCSTGGDIKCSRCCRKQFCGSSKYKHKITLWFTNSTPRCTPKRTEIRGSPRDLNTHCSWQHYSR